MKRSIILTLSIASLAGLFLSVFVFRRYLPYTGIDLGPKQPPSIIMEMKDVYLVGLDDGGKTWSTRAESVEIGRNRTHTKIKNLHQGRIYENGKVALKVRAGSADYDQFTRDLKLSNGVEIEGTKGEKITARGADWNSSLQTLRSKGRVSFQDGSKKVQTDQLLVDLRKKQLEMWDINMTFSVGDINDLR